MQCKWQQWLVLSYDSIVQLSMQWAENEWAMHACTIIMPSLGVQQNVFSGSLNMVYMWHLGSPHVPKPVRVPLCEAQHVDYTHMRKGHSATAI